MRVCDLLVCPLLAGKSLVGVLLFVHALGGRESGRVRDGVTAVSYTHLTLPTIYSV